jgi:hypothetical protein
MAMELPLTKAQRNAVFREFVALNIDPRGLEWTTETDALNSAVSVLKHSSSGFYFKTSDVGCTWSPSTRGGPPTISGTATVWPQQLAFVRQWLTVLKPELEEPDFREASNQENLASRAATSEETGNRPFTIQEQKFISEQLASVQAAVVGALTTGQKEALAAGFRYLEESSRRMGRKDWINVAIGTVINIAVGAAFAPEVGRELLHLLTSSMQGLLSAAVKLLA